MNQIDRLVTLADVWCAVQFFHPWLAYRDEIDWDAALVAAIPAAREAETPDRYAAAIGEMLASLGDPVTCVGKDSKHAPPPEQTSALSHRIESDVVILSFPTDGGLSALITELGKAAAGLKPEARVVFDLRGCKIAAFAVEFSGIGRRLTRQPYIEPGERTRVHHGYQPQTGSSSGGYRSSFLVSDSRRVEPHAQAVDARCAFIVDEKSTLPSAALGLQRAGKAAIIVAGGDEVEPLGETADIKLVDDFVATIRVSEIVSPDGTIGFAPDLTIPKEAPSNAATDAALDWLRRPESAPLPRSVSPARVVGRHVPDRAYGDMTSPSIEYRLLAAFRIWGVFNYFFPYKQLIGESWTGVLREFIPRFEAADSALEYAKTVAEMVTRARDSHCYVSSASLREFIGGAPLPVRLQIIDGQPVVVQAYGADATGSDSLACGDVVRAVDGVGVRARMDLIARFSAASSPQALDSRIATRLLLGPDGSTAIVLIERHGKEIEVRLQRSAANWDLIRPQRHGDIVRMLDGNIGYADLDRLQFADVDAMFEQFKDTKAIIFDMRGYPHVTLWEIASRLATRDGLVGALFECPVVGIEMLSDSRRHDGQPMWQPFLQTIRPTTKWRYCGRTVLLADETTVSQAEHTGLFFKQANGTVLVGSPTTGANGDVTNLVVPGDITIGFTGQAVKHADGRQLQRVGLIPDVQVRPTLAGIRAGRDEVLERALALMA